ncbi:hypothetical protein [Campylobacter hyointestinalis]|uniref:hypothetical protein n=1 Tax=Campylobacter hyointestinalis TaxID=198 RepID=UPI0011AD4DB4|nr:hypothetical protein [Campylobacter hyointestinalis]TWO30708.1 hypothetical protein YZ79_02010 [Campylobacter hyointestinalis]
MYKIIFALMILSSFSFGCVCAPAIQQAYKNLETKITSKLQIHQNELGNLQSNLRDNISNLDKQIAEKKITNALKKELIIRSNEIIFLLTKKLELEN